MCYQMALHAAEKLWKEESINAVDHCPILRNCHSRRSLAATTLIS